MDQGVQMDLAQDQDANEARLWLIVANLFYSWLIGGTHMMDTTNVCLFFTERLSRDQEQHLRGLLVPLAPEDTT